MGDTLWSDTAVRSESHATYTPPISGMSQSTTILEQKWVGACPAGVEPGDRVTADGTVSHHKKQ